MKKRIIIIIFLFLILGSLSVLFYRTSMTSFPKGLHAWSQFDRYALALNFQKNGYDFFHPETYCLNVQFPPEKPLQKENGITRVDFPVHDYAVSLLMLIFNNHEPVIFRLYILIYSLIGLMFLFFFSKNLTGSILNSLFVVVFTFTAPAFTFYQNGFLPTIPSLANLFIALYFYLHYRKSGKFFSFSLSIIFFTLAALARTPFVIFLIALFMVHVLSYLRQKKWLWKESVLFFASFLLVGGYFIYNIYLGKHYGSVFLSSPLPPANWEEAVNLLREIRKNWMFEYLTGWHYIIIIIIFIAALINMILRKSFFATATWAWQYLIIALAGVFFYFIMVMNQFKAHDYYFLDTFFPMIILLLILLFMKLPTEKKLPGLLILIVLTTFSGLFVFRSFAVQQKRSTSDTYNFFDAATTDFKGSARFLDSLNIPADARFVVLNSYSYNIALTMLDRKGYSIYNVEKGELEKIPKKKWDYLAVQEKMPVSDLLNKEPQLLYQVRRIAGNGRIAVYRREILTRSQTPETFLGLDKDAISDTISFDDESSDLWKPYASVIVNYRPRSGKNCARILPENEFMEIMNSAIGKINVTHPKRILVTGYGKLLNWIAANGADLALTLTNSKETYFYSPFKLNEYFNAQDKDWQYFAFQFSIPAHDPNDVIKIYFWNNGRNDFLLDDITITVSPD